MAMVETTPISGVVRFATIAGPAMANTRALVTLEFTSPMGRGRIALAMRSIVQPAIGVRG